MHVKLHCEISTNSQTPGQQYFSGICFGSRIFYHGQ